MKHIPENILKILKNLPKTPWVYQMKDKTNKVIYVGKAKNLHSRVNSYFREGQTLTIAKKNMVSQIVDIETILCSTEVEALTLETNLIKHLSPKYNILMKDDKNLSYIKITKNPVAEVIKTRQKINDGAKYFGPFTQGTNISASLKNLRRIFKIRDCKMQFAERNDKIEIVDKAGRGIPCMDYYIGICPAPCLLQKEKIDEHKQNLQNLQHFLQGHIGDVLEKMQEKMMIFAKNLEFEKAGKIKSEIEALKMLSERQIVRDAIEGNHDICVLYQKHKQFFVGLTKIRDAKIIAVLRFAIQDNGENPSEILSQFLARQYVGEDDLPEHIFLENTLEDEFLNKFFAEQKIILEFPKIGVKKELLDFTRNQVREFAYKRELENLETKTLTKTHMENVLKKLWYPVPKKWPIIFECYDISHTHGQFTYASRVLIKNGKPDPSMYKKYKIKTLKNGEIDDFASHKEVMMRRTIEGLEQNNFPDLIIIDWGKWQLSSALEWIRLTLSASLPFLSQGEKDEKGEIPDQVRNDGKCCHPELDSGSHDVKGSPEWRKQKSGMTETKIPNQIRNDRNQDSGSSPEWQKVLSSWISQNRHPELDSGSSDVKGSLEWREPRFRIKSGMTETKIPDQVRNDGGKSPEWQKQKSGMTEINLQNDWNGTFLPICSIAKREEEIFLPNEKNSILFEKWSGELMVLQKARDESHRFSITANRNARTKAMKKNILEELPWIGPTTRKKLLKIAGNIDEIKNIPEEEIIKIINKKQLETLKDHGIF